MRSLIAASDGKAGRADGLEDEEQEHSGGREDKEQATTSALDAERCGHSPAQVPDSKNTVCEVSAHFSEANLDTYAVISS